MAHRRITAVAFLAIILLQGILEMSAVAASGPRSFFKKASDLDPEPAATEATSAACPMHKRAMTEGADCPHCRRECCAGGSHTCGMNHASGGAVGGIVFSIPSCRGASGNEGALPVSFGARFLMPEDELFDFSPRAEPQPRCGLISLVTITSKPATPPPKPASITA